MLFARGRGVAIVVIVALARLVVLGAAKPRGLNDNSSQFYSSIIVNFFPFCGLEECAMHIDNPQMRGLFFCGDTRQICRGYDRPRGTRQICRGCNQPRGTRQVCRGQNRPWDTRRSNAESSTDGGSARDTRECAGRPFSLCDYPNNIWGNGHRKESHPILILCLSYTHPMVRSR